MSILEYGARYVLPWLLAASWQLTFLVCVVAALTWAARAASPRLRYGLWLLVLLKVFLPPGLTAPWSVGRWAMPPLMTIASQSADNSSTRKSDHTNQQIAGNQAFEHAFASSNYASAPATTIAIVVWAFGCLVFWMAVGWRYRRLASDIRAAAAIDEGPIRVAYEELALELRLRRVPDLFAMKLVASPFLCGVVRPCIVLPQMWLTELSPIELRAVLTHELVHFKHRDTWVGWLQVVAQSAFWFHPLVWWANQELRHQRECVCDETVLRLGQLTPQQYGESIVRAVTASRGRSLVAGSLVGIFERGAKLQDRLEEIMNYQPLERKFGWLSRLALAAVAILLLPMGRAAVSSAAVESGPPQLTKTAPENGARDVDPGLREISVTFDRDMGRGMSWTGGSPEFPPLDEDHKAEWRDLRTCVLPVKLQPGTFYRVGINSTSFENFKSAGGVAAVPSVISFTTKDATTKVQEQLRVPKVVSLEPKNGAMDVDPSMDALKVTFDIPMGEGMSWTGGGDLFPKLADGKKPSWSADGLTCTLPVKLEPGHDYQLGLNSARFKNFQSKAGVPLEPVIYKFRTREK